MLFPYLKALAWFGTLILVVRGVPQAYLCWKQGHSLGLSSSMLWLWFVGSIFMLPNSMGNLNGPIVTVYLTNVLFVGIMLFYKYFPRIKNDTGKKESDCK